MEYVPGIDLARLVARLGPLPVADACEMARQAAQGLEHIRDQGMVHRDLKPSNLILSVDGTVKILDLGLARLRPDECDQDQLTRKNYLLGTADFVAPEQAVDSHTADIRSDIYSLGCTLYKLLNGEPLYGGDKYATWTRKIEAHQRAPLPPLAGPRQQVPEELQAVLRKALAKNVADRYQTPGDFARALAPFARTHHLSTLLRQVDLVPEPSTLPPATPGAGSPLADTSQGPMPASEGKRGKGLSRVHLLIIATSVAFGLCGIILALSYFKSNAPTVSDAKEIGFNALRGESSLVIDPRAGSITVNAPATRQLVSLGKWTAPQGHFAATIEQSDHFWNGDVGFFFGYREEPVRGRAPPGSPKLVGGVLQLIYLHRCELPGQPPQLRWRRQLVQIDPMTQSFNLLSSAIVQGPPFPANPSKIRVAISIDGSGISSFKMNDVEISELSNGSDNQRFKPQDYQGPMGLYNYGENGSRFTAFDLSSLRKE
jgi:hypothetical protein